MDRMDPILFTLSSQSPPRVLPVSSLPSESASSASQIFLALLAMAAGVREPNVNVEVDEP